MSKPSENLETPQISFSAHELGNFDLLVDGVFQILVDQLGLSQPAIAIYDHEEQALKFVKNNSHPLVHSILRKFLNMKISDFSFPLTNQENALVQSYLQREIIVRHSIEDLALPVLSKKISHMIDRVINLKSLIVVPIIDNHKVIGVIAMGSKQTDEYSDKERQLLMSFSAQIGRYIHDSWVLFESNHIKSKDSSINLLKLDKDFLESTGKLLQDLASEQNLIQEERSEIHEHIEYLKSLVLIHDNIRK